MLAEFHFLRPWLLICLLPLALLCFYLWRQKPKMRAWQAICDPNLLSQITQHVGKSHKHFAVFLLFLIGSLMTLALAGPTWERLPQAAYKQKSARVIVIDLSNAMLAKDIKPSRLARAKFKIRDILKTPDVGQIGMVVFTKEGFVVSPLTDDAATVASLVAELSPSIMPLGGSDIASGLQKGAELIKQAGFEQGQIILITASPVDVQAVSMAKDINGQGITLDVLGIGTELGAPVPVRSDYVYDRGRRQVSRLEKTALKELATAGGGQYIDFTSDDSDLERLLKSDSHSAQFIKQKNNKVAAYKDQGRWLIALILPFFLILFRKGYVESIQ